MKRYDAYLFDWDGTLGRTLEIWLEVMHAQFRRYGIMGLADNEVVKSFGRLSYTDKDFGLPSDKLAAFMEDVQQDASKRALDVSLYPGAVEVLDRIKNSGAKLGLITTNWREAIDVMLQNHQLQSMFDVVVSGDDVAVHKPDPEGILAALRSLGVPKEQAVMIGDSDKDLGAARNAGIDSILFYPPSHQLFYDLEELKKYKPGNVIDGWDTLVIEEQ